MHASPYTPVRLDQRGSLNLPVDIKRTFNIRPGDNLFIRVYNGVVILVPSSLVTERAYLEGNLAEWVSAELEKPALAHAASNTPLVSKGALVESLKIQAMRERQAHKERMLQLKMQAAQQAYIIKHSLSMPAATADALAKLQATPPLPSGPVAPAASPSVPSTEPPLAPANPSSDLSQDPDIQALRKQREQESDRRLQTAIEAAEQELAGTPPVPPPFPQA